MWVDVAMLGFILREWALSLPTRYMKRPKTVRHPRCGSALDLKL
jgi:hypothetical protein